MKLVILLFTQFQPQSSKRLLAITARYCHRLLDVFNINLNQVVYDSFAERDNANNF